MMAAGVLLLESGQAEARVLAKEVASLAATPEGLGELLEESVELVAHCRQYPDRLRERRRAFYEASAKPRCVEEMAPAVTGLIHLAGAFQETVEAVRTALGEAEKIRREAEAQWGWGQALPKGDLAVLDATADALRALLSEIAAEWEWLQESPPLNRPLPTSAEVQAALDAGEYFSMEDVLAEIQGTLPEVQ